MDGKQVVFNGLGLCLDRQAGIHRYAREILMRLDSSNLASNIILLVPEGELPCVELENIEIKHHGRLSKKLKRTLWQQRSLIDYVRDNGAIGIDLMLGLPHAGFAYVAIHDCIREKVQENAKTFGRKIRRAEYIERVKAVMKSKAQIITVSEYSKQDICSLYDCNPDRVHIVPNGWEHMNRIETNSDALRQFGLNRRNYFFTLGTRSYHKNHKWVIEAARRNPELVFVVTGGGGGEESVLPNLIYTGYLSDGEVKTLMANATALIEPSFIEGFGIPPLEAISLGTPAIVSNSSCLPEIYGPYVYYLDPNDPSFDFGVILGTELPSPEPLLTKYSWNMAAKQLAHLIEESM